MTIEKNEANKRLIEKINKVEENYTKNFSNTQKILLTTDGSITAILDVLYGKITLSTLEQHFDKADCEISKLIHVDEGAQINYREVIMHKDDENLIYALSYIPLERLTDEICCDLVRADIPIGRILKNYHIESRREVNKIYIEKPNERLKDLFNTKEDMLAREYVIIHKNNVLMWIKEVFPVSKFTNI